MASTTLPRTASALIAAVAAAAAAVAIASANGFPAAVQHHAWTLAAVLSLTCALQALALRGFGSSISVAGIGMLASGYALGVEAAVVAAVLTALVHAAKKRPKPYKAIFNASTFALAAAAGTGCYEALAGSAGHGLREILAAGLGGAAFAAVNIGLLTLAMAAAEVRGPVVVWRERFAWLTPHYLAFGPLAFAAALGARDAGALELAAVALLPLLLAVLVRESLVLARGRGEPRRVPGSL